MRYFNSIIVHCTDTKQGVDVHVKDIDKWHRDNGWSGIGYHYLVCLDGVVEVGRGINVVGAHCKGHNANSVGIAYVGGRDKKGRFADTRTEAQKESLRMLISKLTCQAVEAGFGIPRVYGHRDLDPCKECPCFDAAAEYD